MMEAYYVSTLFTVAGLEARTNRISLTTSASNRFVVSLWTHSPNPSLDLASCLDQPAILRIVPGYAHVANLGSRTFRGIIVEAELIHALQPAAAQNGLSTYFFRIVPELHRLTLRRNQRIFQHLSIPDIIDELLTEHSVEKVWKIDRAAYPKLEFKVQYAESDYNLFSRLLEEAGIAYTFPESEEGKLTLSDRLEANAPRPGKPLRYVDNPNAAAEQEFITAIRFGREVRPGALAIRDHEFRNPDFALFGNASQAGTVEDRLEQFHFDQGSFLVETGKSSGTPVADDKGSARHDDAYAKRLAERGLDAVRSGVRGFGFESNAFDLEPGTIFSVDNHPHGDIGPEGTFLVVETTLEGTTNGEWTLSGQAVFADVPFRPAKHTAKPIVRGFQSARVVGPAGQEIHVDEFGRVRVQFHWDRDGKRNDDSSCWVRVNEGWGGMGYGMVVLPRIGQEVLVAFAEGDPDLPFVLGRAYNAVQQVPYKLPEHKTRSTWKSDSSMGSGGFNEIMFEDLTKKELVWQQAEKDRNQLVRKDEFATVGHDREKLVKNDEEEATEGFRQRWIGKDADLVAKRKKREHINGDVSLDVLGARAEQIDGKQSLLIVADRDEMVEGSHALRAGSAIHIYSGETSVAEGKDVTLGGPGGFLRIDSSGVTISGTLVKINVSGKPGVGKGSKPEEPEYALARGEGVVQKLEIAEITYHDHHTINNDTQDDFTAPQWKKGRSEVKNVLPAQFPVAYVRNTHVKLSAKFDVLEGDIPPEGVQITGQAKLGNDEVMKWIAPAKLVEDGGRKQLVIENVTSDIPLPNQIAAFVDDAANGFSPFTIKWFWSKGSAISKQRSAGESANWLYVLLDTPIKERKLAALALLLDVDNLTHDALFWTTVDLSCRNAKGKQTADEAVRAIYGQFQAAQLAMPRPIKRLRDRVILSYWNPPEVDVRSCAQMLSNPSGSGRCGAWTKFMVDACRSQGIQTVFEVQIQPTQSCGGNSSRYSVFPMIKNWSFSHSPDYAVAITLPICTASGVQTISFTHSVHSDLNAKLLSNIRGGCNDEQGIAAQGTRNPQALFGDHAIVRYVNQVGQTTYYDPSYGTPPCKTPLEWETESLDGILLFDTTVLVDRNSDISKGILIVQVEGERQLFPAAAKMPDYQVFDFFDTHY